MTPEWEVAARVGDVAVLESLMESGVDPDSRDSHGRTALMIASHRGHPDAVRTLIDAGADLDRSAKFGLTATMLAVVAGHEAVVRLLVEAGADLTARGSGAPGFSGKTAADLARDAGHVELAQVLNSSWSDI